MNNAPDRIWIDWRECNRVHAGYDEPPKYDWQDCRDEYVRADLYAAVVAERDRLRAAIIVAGPRTLAELASHTFVLNEDERAAVATICAALAPEVPK
jgi:hypothetical protein